MIKFKKEPNNIKCIYSKNEDGTNHLELHLTFNNLTDKDITKITCNLNKHYKDYSKNMERNFIMKSENEEMNQDFVSLYVGKTLDEAFETLKEKYNVKDTDGFYVRDGSTLIESRMALYYHSVYSNYLTRIVKDVHLEDIMYKGDSWLVIELEDETNAKN